MCGSPASVAFAPLSSQAVTKVDGHLGMPSGGAAESYSIRSTEVNSALSRFVEIRGFVENRARQFIKPIGELLSEQSEESRNRDSADLRRAPGLMMKAFSKRVSSVAAF